jgi:hypothetical protein
MLPRDMDPVVTARLQGGISLAKVLRALKSPRPIRQYHFLQDSSHSPPAVHFPYPWVCVLVHKLLRAKPPTHYFAMLPMHNRECWEARSCAVVQNNNTKSKRKQWVLSVVQLEPLPHVLEPVGLLDADIISQQHEVEFPILKSNLE